MTQHPAAEDPRIRAERAINTAFSPHSPINQAQFFRGRRDQIREVVDTVTTSGLHAVIYGERGVGKTSLANIISDYLGDVVAVSKVICSQGDTFAVLVRRALGSLQLTIPVTRAGLIQTSDQEAFSLLDRFPPDRDIAGDEVATLLANIPLILVIVVDEFDRLPRTESAAFADLIKAMSDRGATTTVVLVGVAESINDLLASHASVERCLRQIHLPRMSETELREIIDRGLADAGFSLASAEPRERIISVSQGFPHYTHLLTQYAARTALDAGRAAITDADVIAGMRRAVDRADQSTRELYHKATTGTRQHNLWRQVVAACAYADSDERGYFSSRAVQQGMSEIMGRSVRQQTLAYHLGKLIETDHGPLLERVGPERRYRYRFINPLMRPFILMHAMNDGLIAP